EAGDPSIAATTSLNIATPRPVAAPVRSLRTPPGDVADPAAAGRPAGAGPWLVGAAGPSHDRGDTRGAGGRRGRRAPRDDDRDLHPSEAAMVTMRERWGRDWRLNWRAILAGGVLAIGAAWAGELLGGLLSLIEPGESSAWGWLGGILALGMTLAGAFAGGWIAARAAGADERSNGLLHGLV